MDLSDETGTVIETGVRGERPRVTLYVRTPADFGTRGRQQDVLGRLDRLQTDERIETYSVEHWDKSVVIDGAELERSARVVGTVESFREWAAERDRSLNPAFREHHVRGRDGERSYVRLTLPVMCLAVYEGDDVAGVFPSRDATTSRVHTVCDAIDALEGEEGQWAEFDDGLSATHG